jgi:hypothetical protein
VRRYDLDSLENRDPQRIRWLWRVLGPAFKAYFRPVVLGLERIPAGPAPYVGNHNGFVPWDAVTFFGELLDRRGVDELPYALGHEFTMALPVVHQLLAPLGALRLDRLLRAKAWPLVLSIPWGLTIGPPLLYFPLRSRFYQEALEPILFEPNGPEAADDASQVERCHAHVLAVMQAGLDRLVERREAERGGRHGGPWWHPARRP